MSTKLVVSNESKTRARSTIVDSKPNPTWTRFLPLVFLILIELGGMIVLCYRCLHPRQAPIFEGR